LDDKTLKIIIFAAEFKTHFTSLKHNQMNHLTMEIKDNQLLRQFETQTTEGLLVLEYSIQERKLFLTKLNPPENLEDELIDDFIKMVLATAEERKFKVVPIHPKLALFFRKNPFYRELLPPGIKL
jgi:predicted metalloenzyme YecM